MFKSFINSIQLSFSEETRISVLEKGLFHLYFLTDTVKNITLHIAIMRRRKALVWILYIYSTYLPTSQSSEAGEKVLYITLIQAISLFRNYHQSICVYITQSCNVFITYLLSTVHFPAARPKFRGMKLPEGDKQVQNNSQIMIFATRLVSPWSRTQKPLYNDYSCFKSFLKDFYIHAG